MKKCSVLWTDQKGKIFYFGPFNQKIRDGNYPTGAWDSNLRNCIAEVFKNEQLILVFQVFCDGSSEQIWKKNKK